MSETKTETTKVPAQDAQAAKDAAVLAGVMREPTETKPEAPVPARRGRRAPATETKTTPARKVPAKAAPATKTIGSRKAPARKAPATTPKTTAKTTPAKDKVAANGATPREGNTKLAVELIDLVAANFSGKSKADQVKIANWLKSLPTGGRAYLRYWPKGFARPTSADWRKPE